MSGILATRGQGVSLLLAASLAAISVPSAAAPIDVTNDAVALANALLGTNSGFTLIEATYAGPAVAAGLQSTGSGFPGNPIGPGILITTGSAAVALGPQSNLANTRSGAAGSTALEAYAGAGASFDAVTLTLKLQGGSTASKGKFNFNFGTDDSGTSPVFGPIFNDTFAAFLSTSSYTGNVAFDASSNPLRINSALFPDYLAPAPTTAYDRQTGTLQSVVFDVLPNEVFSLSFAIADFGDDEFDTGVYLADLGVLTGAGPLLPPGPGHPLEGTALNVHLEDADGNAYSDMVAVNSAPGAREIQGGNSATSIGNFLFANEFIDARAGSDDLGHLILLLDMSLCGGGDISQQCAPSGKFTYSGWDPSLSLLAIGGQPIPESGTLPNIVQPPTYVFDGDSVTFDWLSARGQDPNAPLQYEYILIFEQTSIPEPASLAIVAVALVTLGAGLAVRKPRDNARHPTREQ